MYRLCAVPFLRANMAVAIVGYRTYSDADVDGQVDDLEAAAVMLRRDYPHLLAPPDDDPSSTSMSTGRGGKESWTGVTLAGHSSGAHIALLLLIRRLERLRKSTTPTPAPQNTGLKEPQNQYNFCHVSL